MPDNNFQIFNENNNQYTTMSDEEYASLDYRFNGLIPMIADPIAHNKMFRQWSIMAKAVADMICDKGYNALDTDVTDLKNNLKTSVKGLARDELQSDINSKADIDHTHTLADITDVETTANELNVLHGLTATAEELNTLDGITSTTEELNILDGVTASTAELNILDGAEISTTELNYLSGAKSNIQTQINNLSISAFIPLRQDSTAYAIGDVVKIAGLSTFQYLECIASGTSGNGSVFSAVNTIGDNEVGTTYVDGTVIWLVCDMRDGLQAGDMKYRFSLNDIDGYIKMNGTKSLLLFDKNNPITNNVNFKYLRLFRLILNQALYTYTKDSLFNFEVSASPSTASTNPILLHGAGVVLINQWCNLSPLGFSTIEDITLQDYIDISTYNTNNSVSYTEAQYKETAQKLLDDILNNNTGKISIKISDIKDRYIKLQDARTEWTSRLENEGLPNITGNLGNLVSGSDSNTNPSRGALRWGGRGTVTRYQNASTTTANNWYDPEFDASRSNSIYGNNSHVTPASLHLCPFIKY